MDFEDPSEAGVNKNLDLLYGSGGNSPGLGSIQHYRLHNGVENPDLGVDTNRCGSPDVLQLEESCSCFADMYCHVHIYPPMPVNYAAQVRETVHLL